MVELNAKIQCLNILKTQLNKRLITLVIKKTQIFEFILLSSVYIKKKYTDFILLDHL